MKKYRKIFLIGALLITLFISSNNVLADAVCKTYKNYYFFTQTNKESKFNEIYANGTENLSEGTFAALELEEYVKDVKKGTVCLYKNSESDCSYTTTDESWKLDDFYTAYRLLEKRGINQTTGSGITSGIYEFNKDDNTVIRYYSHGAKPWYKIEGDNKITGSAAVDLTLTSDDISVEKPVTRESTNAELIAATALPYDLTISLDWSEEKTDAITGQVKRKMGQDVTASDFELVPLYYPDASNHEGAWLPSVLSMGLYKIEYTYCTYNATINYYYEGTTDRVEFEDDPNPYTNSELEPDTSYNVPSPELEGCTLVKASDEKVNVHIDKDDPKDFTYDVYYRCESEPIDEEPEEILDTGDALIIVAWFVAALAIGYSVYYFLKNRKSSSN